MAEYSWIQNGCYRGLRVVAFPEDDAVALARHSFWIERCDEENAPFLLRCENPKISLPFTYLEDAQDAGVKIHMNLALFQDSPEALAS